MMTFDPTEPRHTLLCTRCRAILAVADSDEDYERERRCSHCGVKWRLIDRDAKERDPRQS